MATTDPKWRAPGGAARVEIMIEQNASARQQPAKEDDASLDEARLRQQAIGVKLRQMFDQVVNEPVPDEFLDILRRADARTKGRDE